MTTSGFYRAGTRAFRGRSAPRGRRGGSTWPAAPGDALFVATVLLLFSGVSCYDDDDCHTHVACCGGITVLRHCHSSGGGGHTHPGYDAAAQVTVLATDAPDERVRSLYVTVTEITLESGEVDPQTLYRSGTGHRVDLLSLRGSKESRLYELLAAPSLVHSATYDSIWISVKDPAIVLRSGEVVPAEDIELDGALDIVFREPALIGPDDATYLVLDFDVKRSLSRSSTGADSGRPDAGSLWRFRPIIFATVIRGDASVSTELPTPADLEGTIDELDLEEGTFDLDLSDGRGTVKVHRHGETALRATELKRLRFEDLQLGQTLRVRGLWRHDGRLDADTVLRGDTFRIEGRVARVDPDGIVLSTRGEENREETLRVDATRDTTLTYGRLEGASLGDIETGFAITATGYRSGDGASRIAALVDLRPGRTEHAPLAVAGSDSEERIGGRVARIERDSRTVVLRAEDGATDRRVRIPPGSEILFLERTGGVLWQTPMHFEQIRPELSVEIERLPASDDSPELVVFHLRG